MSQQLIAAILKNASRLFVAFTVVAAGLLATGLLTQDATVARQPVAAAAKPAPQPAVVPAEPEAEPELDLANYVIKRVLDIGGPLKHGEHHWDDEGIPDGQLVITVDLKAETLSVFRDGYEIGVAAIMYGHDDKQTPLGVFPITQKSKDHVSNLYFVPMPYMLRLTNDGISIHGGDVEYGYATHGCIAVPNEFAAKLFAVAKLGDKVIITNGEMLDVGGAVTAI